MTWKAWRTAVEAYKANRPRFWWMTPYIRLHPRDGVKMYGTGPCTGSLLHCHIGYKALSCTRIQRALQPALNFTNYITYIYINRFYLHLMESSGNLLPGRLVTLWRLQASSCSFFTRGSFSPITSSASPLGASLFSSRIPGSIAVSHAKSTSQRAFLA